MTQVANQILFAQDSSFESEETPGTKISTFRLRAYSSCDFQSSFALSIASINSFQVTSSNGTKYCRLGNGIASDRAALNFNCLSLSKRTLQTKSRKDSMLLRWFRDRIYRRGRSETASGAFAKKQDLHERLISVFEARAVLNILCIVTVATFLHRAL